MKNPDAPPEDMGTPSPELTENDTVTYEQIKQWNSEGYRMEKHGDNFSVVIIGELHGRPDLQEQQVNLIKSIRPDYVLHEFLQGWIYNPETQEFSKQEGRKVRDEDGNEIPEAIIAAANEAGFKVIGCDLTNIETSLVIDKVYKRNPGKYHYDSFVEEYVPNEGVEHLNILDPEIMAFRDKKMADTIIEYQKKSKKPIVVIVGADHGKGTHKNKILQRAGISYVLINQAKIVQK